MKKKVAFICVHNSCRSQIAEALGKYLASDVFDSYSAGTETKPQINQDAVRIMKELYGIDMERSQYSKLIDDIPNPDVAISMGCNVGCPFIGRAFDDNWGLEDPTGKSDEEFKIIIKEIENRILELRNSMNKQIVALATDENNMVMWDIDILLLDYKDHSYITIDTEKLVPKEWLEIDKKYALTTNVNIPIILFELPNNQLFVADGNHRLYRAVTENIEKMNAIVIPQDKHLAYLFKSTEEIYYRVVDGLKDEGIFINNFICN